MTLLTWKKIGKPTPLTLTLGTALLLRLIVIPLLYDDYNYWAFGVFTNLLLTGNNPYHIVTNDPTLLNINPWRYPPLFLTFTAPALIAKTITGSTLAYLATLKIPLAMADLVSAFYVYKILLFRFPERTALKFTVLYAFNPLVIFESAGGGFNDPIPIALTVVSLYYFVSYRERKDSSHNHELGTSAFLLGLGIAAKIYPLLLLPVFLREIRGTMSRLGYAVVTILPMALVSTPFMISDSTSYIGLLIVRSVGGLHPLIPFASLGGAIGPLAIASLVVLLLWTYVTTVELLTRITLVFLWVNIAIFAQSLNYMMWGIPFFTILAAENHKMWGSTLSAGVTFVTALIFQGWYNGSTGETGLFYWSDHLLHQQVVVFRLYPFSTIDPVILVTTLLLLSVAVNAIYFILCRLPNTSGFRDANTRESERSASPKVFSKKQFSLFGSICLLILLSWSATGLFANFEPHEYPVVKGSYFQFEDHFHTSILGYQWAFRGGGNYSVNPSQGYLDISDSQNATGYVYRGWQDTVNGFHPSSSWIINFSFRFKTLLPGRSSFVLANMTDGILSVQRNQTTEYFQYSDQIHNENVVFSNADTIWHNFTERYSQGWRTVQIDNSARQLRDGSFSKLVLGDFNSGGSFGGRAQFSEVNVIVSDFPSGPQAAHLGWTELGISLGLIAIAFFLVNGRARGLLQRISRISGQMFDHRTRIFKISDYALLCRLTTRESRIDLSVRIPNPSSDKKRSHTPF